MNPVRSVFAALLAPACLVCLSLFSVVAAEINVAGTRLSIPVPEGCEEVTSNMQPYWAISQRFVPPSNEQHIQFLPMAEAQSASKGETPDAPRRFYVQTARKMASGFITTADFEELKRLLKNENEKVLKKVEKEIPGMLENVNKGLAKDFNVDVGLAMNQMVPLPSHWESDRGFAYSMLMKFTATDENGKDKAFEGIVTASIVHVQGKVLFLYVNAEKSALDWCRQESQKWADSVIAANPSSGDIATTEKGGRSSFSRGFSFSRIAVWALVGGVIGLVVQLFKKRS